MTGTLHLSCWLFQIPLGLVWLIWDLSKLRLAQDQRDIYIYIYWISRLRDRCSTVSAVDCGGPPVGQSASPRRTQMGTTVVGTLRLGAISSRTVRLTT